MIDLDYNPSTPLEPSVREAMLPCLGSRYGNPSSTHAMGPPLRDVSHALASVTGAVVVEDLLGRALASFLIGK